MAEYTSPEHHPAFEEYCETIFELEEDGQKVIQARIAERLDVSRPAVSEMVRRLEDTFRLRTSAILDRVSTADVADECIGVATLFCRGEQHLGGELDDGVAAHEAVVVVERLEVVEIRVNDGHRLFAAHPRFQLARDPEVAGQAGQG